MQLQLIENGEKTPFMPLTPQYRSFADGEDVRVVYQDAEYDLIIQCDDSAGRAARISVLINNDEIGSLTGPDGGKANIGNKRIFNMFFGAAEITVRLEFMDGTERYLFSPRLVIAVDKRHEDTLDSVRDILNDIYQKNHALLCQKGTRNSSSLPKSLQNQNSKYEEEIGTLYSIVQVLHKNLPYFMQSPKYAAAHKQDIDSIQKLRSISNKNLQYIVTHPEHLRPSYSAQGVLINKTPLIPDKTLVNIVQYNYDTYENRTIIAFVKTLLQHIEVRRTELRRLLDSGINYVRPKEPVKSNYILSSSIIPQYTQTTFEKYYNSLCELKERFSNLFVQFIRALPCEASVLKAVPRPTPIFLEVYHYRNIYETIQLWFGFGDFDLPAESLALRLTSADVLYEYYCLLNIYDSLINLGFSEETGIRDLYVYQNVDSRFENTLTENTFYLKRDDVKVVLYYQPVIYSAPGKTNNGITLCRTDRSYFTPDFVIKKQDADGNADYAIIDAKWRDRGALMNRDSPGGLYESVYKYYYSIVDSRTLLPCGFFWLLQGKDDLTHRLSYYHNQSAFSKSQPDRFKKRTGVVRLTPKSGIFEVTEIIRSFLNQ
jgi:hypothetical protein